jgi:hypothetical protein
LISRVTYVSYKYGTYTKYGCIYVICCQYD